MWCAIITKVATIDQKLDGGLRRRRARGDRPISMSSEMIAPLNPSPI